jgi:membrane associated rhomboid family serine protease
MVYILWHAPFLLSHNIMNHYFVCHRSNLTLRNAKFVSLLLSAISHIDFWHLLYNVIALLSFGPSIQSIFASNFLTKGDKAAMFHPKLFKQQASADVAMWFFVIGSALSGSIAYLLWNEIQGIVGSGCLGLSAVTMSFLSIYALAYPNRTLQFRLGGVIPLRIPAGQLLQMVFLGSILGCIMPTIIKSRQSDNIAHSGHLGGMLFGILYYKIVIMNNVPFRQLFIKTPP